MLSTTEEESSLTAECEYPSLTGRELRVGLWQPGGRGGGRGLRPWEAEFALHSAGNREPCRFPNCTMTDNLACSWLETGKAGVGRHGSEALAVTHIQDTWLVEE